MTFPVIARPPIIRGSAAVDSPTLILDQLSTSTLLALSTSRRLTGTYHGPLIRVRRSSDNVERDIQYGDDNLLDTTALTAFIGANDGFVVKIYDQSGNGADAGQATTTKQPKIVNAGSVVTNINSKPCANFDGTDDFLVTAVDMDTVIDRTSWCVYGIARFETVNGGFFTDPWNAPHICGGYAPPAGGYFVLAGQHFAFSDCHSYDGSNDNTSVNCAYTQPRGNLVYMTWRDAGTMYAVHGTQNSIPTIGSVATGVRTASPGVKLGIGASYGSPNAYIDGQIMELISFVSLPSLADRNTLGNDQGALAGENWVDLT
jgi:hypothetical protein